MYIFLTISITIHNLWPVLQIDIHSWTTEEQLFFYYSVAVGCIAYSGFLFLWGALLGDTTETWYLHRCLTQQHKCHISTKKLILSKEFPTTQGCSCLCDLCYFCWVWFTVHTNMLRWGGRRGIVHSSIHQTPHYIFWESFVFFHVHWRLCSHCRC